MPKYTMCLNSVGNPDFQQYAPVSNPETVHGDTLEKMRDHVDRYIRYWNLGMGNWTHPVVLEGDKVVGHFSYSGKLWPGRFKNDASMWSKKAEILLLPKKAAKKSPRRSKVKMKKRRVTCYFCHHLRVKATYIAAQSVDSGVTVDWKPICASHRDGWNEGGDWQAPVLKIAEQVE